MDELRKSFRFGRDVNSAELYHVLKQVADATGSLWSLTYLRTVDYHGDVETPMAYIVEASGIIEKEDLQLEMKASFERWPNEKFADSLENYFDTLDFHEAHGWKSGIVATDDRRRLENYSRELSNALLQSNIVQAVEAVPVE